MRGVGFVTRIGATVLALWAGACSPGCDEDALRDAAAAIETAPRGDRRVGLDALGHACPTMPAVLRETLALRLNDPGPDDTVVLYQETNDLVWQGLRANTCADAEVDDATMDPDRRTRERCRLDRYGLLAPDDVFVSRDFVVFVLYQWLLDRDVDRELAQRVVWPLLSASASAEELEAMCRDRADACAHAFAAAGIQPPRSTCDVRLRDATTLRLSSTALALDRTHVLALQNGRPAVDAFVNHVSPVLRGVLENRVEAGRVRAEHDGESWEGRLEVMADRSTPFATVADVLFTATKTGFVETALLVDNRGRPATIVVAPPLRWLEPDPDRSVYDRASSIILTVGVDRVVARVDGGAERVFAAPAVCDPPPSGCHDTQAIAGWAEEVKRGLPHETVVTLRVSGEVSLQAVVAILDAVRGETCRLHGALLGEEVPPECLFWQPILDADPPFYFNMDRPGPVLGQARVLRRQRSLRGGPSKAALLAAYAQARVQIERCLPAHPELIGDLDVRDDLIVLFGRSPNDARRSTARLFHRGLRDGAMERCVLDPLGVEIDRRAKPLEFLVGMQVELHIPTVLGDPAR